MGDLSQDLRIRIDREEALAQLLVDCDEIARRRGDTFGLCDAVDNSGNYYQSAALAAWLEYFKDKRGMKPMLRVGG